MGWVAVLGGSGSSDRFRLNTSNNIVLSGDFRIVIENFRYITAPTGTDFGAVLGTFNAFNNFSPCARASVGGWTFRVNNSTYTIPSTNVPIPTSNNSLYEFKRDGGTGTLTVGGASHSQTINTGDFQVGCVGTLNFDRIITSQEGNIEVGNISIYDSTGSLVYYFDVDNSDHSAGSQPEIIETVESRDFIGFNFPTDGSAWIDLGGGGGVSLDIDSASLLFSANSLQARKSSLIDIDQSSLLLEANELNLLKSSDITLQNASISFSSNQIELQKNSLLAIDTSSVDLLASSISLTYEGLDSFSIDLDSSLLGLSGGGVGLSKNSLINIDSAQIYLFGHSITLSRTIGFDIDLDVAKIELLSNSINLTKNSDLFIDSSSIELSGHIVNLAYSESISLNIDNFNISYSNNTVKLSYINDNLPNKHI